jgi:hypothetical protein
MSPVSNWNVPLVPVGSFATVELDPSGSEDLQWSFLSKIMSTKEMFFPSVHFVLTEGHMEGQT